VKRHFHIWAARSFETGHAVKHFVNLIDVICTQFDYDYSHPAQLSLAIRLWEGAMSTSQRAVTPCGWGVKAGMVCSAL